MKVTSFQNFSAKYAAIIGRHAGVTITFGGDEAFTNGKHINLPAFPAGTVLTPYEARVFGGYLDHETAHVRFTDFLRMKNEKLHEEFKKQPALHALFNVILDIRDENLQIGTYPGSKSYLDELAREVDQKAKRREGDESQLSKGSKVFRLFYREAWAKYREIDTGTIEGWLDDQPETKPIADLMRNRMSKLRTEMDVFALAKDLLPLFPKENPQMGGVSVDIRIGTGKEKLEGKGKKGKGGNPEKVLEDRDRGKFLTILLEQIKESNHEVVDKKENEGRFTSVSWVGKRILPPYTTAHDKIFVPSPKNRAAFLSERNALQTEIKALKKMMRIYLQAHDKDVWSRGLEEGEIDHEHLYQLFTGSPNVYKELRSRRITNTAVLLLLDLSGSMNSSIVRKTSIALAEALNAIREVKLAISGFTTTHKTFTNPDPTKKRGIGRNQPVNILLFKGFDESYAKSQDRIGAIYTSNNTPLGDAYGYGFEYLLLRKEKRRILWIVSDGEPYLQLVNEDHNELLLMESLKKKSHRYGIETWGLGIGQGRRLGKYVHRYAEIDDPCQLSQALLPSLKELAR